MDYDELVKGLQTSADWLNTVILFALSVAAVATLLKVLNQPSLKVWGVDFQVSSAWIPLLALTVAHIGVAAIHLRGAAAIMYDPAGLPKQDSQRIKALRALTTSGPLIFRHVVQRAEVESITLPNPAKPLSDPLAIPSYLAAVIFLLAQTRWKDASPRRRAMWVAWAVIVTAINWTIASWWILGTAELAGSRDAVRYLILFK